MANKDGPLQSLLKQIDDAAEEESLVEWIGHWNPSAS